MRNDNHLQILNERIVLHVVVVVPESCCKSAPSFIFLNQSQVGESFGVSEHQTLKCPGNLWQRFHTRRISPVKL